jgi:hypothetical protein
MPRQMPTTLGPRIRAQARGGSLPLTFQIGSRDSKERKVESVKRKVVDLFSASDTRTCVAKRLHSFTLYVLHFTLSLRLRDVEHLEDHEIFGVLSFVPDERELDAYLVVTWRGNIITARFLHENSFEFEMQAKIFIDTNHLPYITDQTLFESGRIKIIPFNRHFKPKERDLRLGAKLSTAESLSGILNWCIEGYKLYKTEGLIEPPEVVAATEKYRLDSDRMGQFFAQCLKKEMGSELKPSAIYTRYRTGSEIRGCHREARHRSKRRQI